MSKNIKFYYNNIVFKVTKVNRIKEIINTICKDYGFEINQIDYIFCNDEYILDINRQFLNHDFYTDIITFDYSINKLITSEIYISIDTVKYNAGLFKTSQVLEIQRVILHGVLHLVGFKDKSKKDQKVMREMEDKYLNMLNSK